MIELKVELMKKRREYEESKKNPSTRQSKKLPTPPKGVQTIPQLTEEDLKRSREALEVKSRLYEKLEKGKVTESDLNASQRENLLVDFTWKGWNPETEDFEFSSDEEDVDDNPCKSRGKIDQNQLLQLLNTETIDRWIEYEDEFGRLRVAKLSHLRQIQQERQEVIDKLQSTTSHYDGDAEVRNKGVGFYRFAVADEEERRKQMKELTKLREETVEKRLKNLLIKEERRLRIESRLARLKERKSLIKEEE